MTVIDDSRDWFLKSGEVDEDVIFRMMQTFRSVRLVMAEWFAGQVSDFLHSLR